MPANSVPRFGVDLPYFADPVETRDYAQAVEAMGYDHISFNEHILGADPDSHPGVRLINNLNAAWHEQFTLMAFLAGLTSRIELAPSMLLMPLRPAALVAKQAAEVDHFSGGRLRIEASVSWNALEYEALGVDFKRRGEIIEEQVEVLRALWTQRVVDFQGKFHTIRGMGLNPRPVQQPIPIWMGGGLPGTDGVPRERVLRRMARLADGYKTLTAITLDSLRDIAGRLRSYAVEYGRDPASVGIEARLRLTSSPEDREGNPEDWMRQYRVLTEIGVSHINVIGFPGRGALTTSERLALYERFMALRRTEAGGL